MTKIIAASTAAIAAVLLVAGCGFETAVPSPAAVEAAPSPLPVKTVKAEAAQTRVKEPSRKDRKAALILLLLGAHR